MDNGKRLYDQLSKDKLYTKSYDEFVNQFGSPDGQKRLYNTLKEQNLYTKSEQEFVGQFWSKKKDQTQGMVSATPSETTKPSSVSKGQIVTGPSASFGQLGNKLQVQEQKPSPSKEAQEEIGIIDDLWNTVKGAGAKTLATLASIPQYQQTTALDVFMSATGMKSDFNKLPSADKKQIRDALGGMLTASSRAAGTANQGVAVGANLSQKSYDFLNKKSEDIYKKTRQEEIDVVDELAKFGENPNAESIKKVLYQGLKTTFESAPYMAIGMASLPALAITSAAGKREEDISKEGDVGIGNLLNAGIYGAAEAVFEGTTNKILRKAANSAVGNPKAAKAVAEGFVKSVLKDFGQEAASEGATTAIQDLSDRITKGENIQDINYYKLAKNVANSAILGGISGGGISLTASTAGAARKYVASKIMPKDQIEKINNNTKTIQSLNLEHGEDVDPRVNEIVNKKIDELVAENEAIIAENEKIAENLSADQIKQVFDIDDKLEENYNSAKSIIDDAAMDDKAKKLLLDDLLKQQNNLKQEKDAIQKQTTSEVPVQPETGISGEVAKGEPQAEPQVPAEEVKVEEVKKALEDLKKAKSVKYWMQPEFLSESRGQPKNDEPNGFTYDMVDTSEGKATIINTYDQEGKIVATMSILDVPSGDSPKGAFKISTREDAQKQGYASRLLDEASRMGYNIPSLMRSW